MIGSLHLGLQDNALVTGEEEQDLVAHLAAVISACLRLGVSRQQVSRLTVLDPVTGIGNLRVITSYSIHYTKLYDSSARGSCCHRA